MPQPNMQQLLKQAQKMQEEMAKAQASLKDEVVTATAGGGAVSVEVTGEMLVKSITIAPEAVDPDDVEMLGDLILAAVNQGIEKSQQLAAERMNAITGGMGGGLGIPGL